MGFFLVCFFFKESFGAREEGRKREKRERGRERERKGKWKIETEEMWLRRMKELKTFK